MIDRQQLFYISPDVLSQEIDTETVLLDMKSEQYFGLNDVGGSVLQFLTEGATLDTLVSQLLEEYDVDQKQLEDDIAELLQDLLNAGLIGPEAP